MQFLTLLALCALVAALPSYRSDTDLDARSHIENASPLFVREEMDDSLVARDDKKKKNKTPKAPTRVRPSGAGPVMGGMADMTAQIVDWRMQK